MKVFLAPKVLWNKDDFHFTDNTVQNYIAKDEASWGLLMELPAIPRVGDKVCLSGFGEYTYLQLKEYLRLPTSSIAKLVNSYRFHKNLSGGEMSWGADNPVLSRYDNEDLLAALCYSRLEDSLTDNMWTATKVIFIPESDTVFVEVSITKDTPNNL